MHDLHILIRKIKKAPSMYLGRHSILCLQAFLSGYNVAKFSENASLTPQEEDFKQFPEWIRQKFNIQTSQSWASIILFFSEDERKALDTFFELFEEFVNRDCTPPSGTAHTKEYQVLSALESKEGSVV
ncbi:hypothetical protein [Iningainema tapete]|uniref:Uncharacterized protein n=1 Tax=Iningainema tapete BLCC-T55 TaxID=2748662 RepID=A0A8J6XDL0_9CYAN|nr:hypothetical protein [Iningainema tapete]MBD2774110.1 hypothetical protein [Iningainema tapete BLCC-T55]